MSVALPSGFVDSGKVVTLVNSVRAQVWMLNGEALTFFGSGNAATLTDLWRLYGALDFTPVG